MFHHRIILPLLLLAALATFTLACKKQLLEPKVSWAQSTNEESEQIERVLGLFGAYKTVHFIFYTDASFGLDIVDMDGQYLHLCWDASPFNETVPREMSQLWVGTNNSGKPLPNARRCKIGDEEEQAIKVLCEVIARKFLPPELQKELREKGWEESRKRWELKDVSEEQDRALTVFSLLLRLEEQEALGYNYYSRQ